MIKLFGILAIILFVLTACTTTNESIEKDVMIKDSEDVMEKTDAIIEKTDGTVAESYSGKVLAGTTVKYLEFNKADYELAQKEGKTILLYFYANWCPTCRAEQPQTHAAFDEATNENVIGFRVNYNDDQTDADEKALAKEFGITYQHTKVIVKDGEQVLKSLNTWKKEQYLEEIRKY